MPEVQTAQHSGEMARRFIEFILMHSQNAAFFLGQIPNPQTSQPEINLDMARIFIDQLEMIREKTKGNLTKEETDILDSSLTNLRLAFVSAKNQVETQQSSPAPAPTTPSEPTPADPQASSNTDAATPSSSSDQPSTTSSDDSESKKRFTKSYGP